MAYAFGAGVDFANSGSISDHAETPIWPIDSGKGRIQASLSIRKAELSAFVAATLSSAARTCSSPDAFALCTASLASLDHGRA